MHTVLLSNNDLNVIITSLEIEATRIKQYNETMLKLRGIAMPEYDAERIVKIEALAEELKRERGH